MLVSAIDIGKKALLLYFLATNIQEIFETLTPANNSFPGAHLRKHRAICYQFSLYIEYGYSLNDNIRDQIISFCHSTKLRKQLLTETDLTLEQILQLSKTMGNAEALLQKIEK